MPWDFLNALYPLEAFHHSEENIDRAIVFNIYRTISLYSLWIYSTKKLIDAKINKRKREPHCFICWIGKKISQWYLFPEKSEENTYFVLKTYFIKQIRSRTRTFRKSGTYTKIHFLSKKLIFDRFEGTDFNYDNSFLIIFLPKNTQIRYFWS